MNNEVIDIIISQPARKEVQDLVKDLIAADKAFLDLANDVDTFNKKGFKVKGVKDYVAHTEQAARVTKGFNAEEKERIRIGKAVEKQFIRKNQAQDAVNKTLIKQRYETQQLNKQVKEEVVLTSRLSTEYQRLVARMNKTGRELQSLVAKKDRLGKLSAKEDADLRKLTRDYGKYRSSVNKADAAIGRHQRNVGNYSSALSGLRGVVTNLVGAFGVIEGVRMAFDFTKEAIALAREAKGVEFAFERLGKTGVQAFENVKKSTRGLISDLDIKTALVDFDNFNISLEQSDVLFEFLAVRAAQTGKSIDKLKESLVEGLSKESKLRIDNLGISAAELNAELEKTPDFVTAVANIAKREVKQAGDILDEAANGGEKLASSFQNAKLSFGQLFEGNSSSLIGSFANQIDRVAFGFKVLKDGIRVAKNGFDDITKPIVKLINDVPILNKSVKLLTHLFTTPGITVFGDFLRKVGANLSGMSAAFIEVRVQVKNFVSDLTKLGSIEFDILNPRKTALSAKAVLTGLVGDFKNGGTEVANAYRDAYKKALAPIAKETQDILNSGNASNASSSKEVNKAIEGSITHYEGLISSLKKSRKETSLTKDEYTLFTAKINDAEDALERLKEALGAVNSSELSLNEAFDLLEPQDDIDYDALYDEDVAAHKKAQEQKAANDKLYKDSLDRINENILQSKEQLYGNLLGLAEASIAAVFNAEAQQYQDRINENNEFYAAKLEAEGLSDKASRALEAERDRKNLELQRKKEKAEEKAFLLGQGAALAEIIIDTTKSVLAIKAQAAVLASNPVTAPLAAAALAQIPFVIGSGAAAGATVAATSLPAFEKGKKSSDNYEGAMLWGEKRPEVKVSRYGEIEFASKPTIGHTKKGDTIYPSIAAFASSPDAHQIMQQTYAMNMASQGEQLSRYKPESVETAVVNALKKITAPVNNINVQPAPFDSSKLAKEMWILNEANKA